jgi:protein TonB
MERYAPIHPERPVGRAIAAVAVSLALHAAAYAVLVAWALSVLAALRKAEAERPKEVAIAELDAARWEENRRLAEPSPAPPAHQAPPQPPGVAMIAPGAGELSRPPPDGPARERGPSPTEASPLPAPVPGLGSEPGPAPGELPDLLPRPQPIRPLALRFDPMGGGQRSLDEGSAFGGLTVQTPEAWRFTNFFGRAVEAMNSVYRYELGSPVPLALQERLASHRAREGCSYTTVRIDRGGRVLEASVRRSSGIPELDQLIIEVIRRTAPFVNVPEGLTDDRGVYGDTWGLCIGYRR